MLAQLLGSKTRAALLTLFLMRPERRHHLRGLQRETRVSMGALQHELKNLSGLGLLLDEREGNARFYQINEAHPLFTDLRSLVLKTTGFGDVLREALADVGGIEAAFVYGSIAKNLDDAASDVDLFVLGSPNSNAVHAAVSRVEESVKRSVNAAVFTRAEVASRLAASDPYLTGVFEGDKVVVIGDAHELPGARG